MLDFAGCSYRVRRWNPVGRENMMIFKNRLPMVSNVRSLETRKRKMGNQHNDVPLKNVLLITVRR